MPPIHAHGACFNQHPRLSRAQTVETNRVESKVNDQGQRVVNQVRSLSTHCLPQLTRSRLQYVITDDIGRGSFGVVRKVFNTQDRKFYVRQCVWR